MLLTGVSALALTGCAKSDGGGKSPGSNPPRACTEMGCLDGLRIELKSDAWPDGVYRFEVEADGASIVCQGSLPLPACGTAAITCDQGGVIVGESGCALPPAQHSFSELIFEGAPERVSLNVEHEGAIRVTHEVQPEYRTVTPNGPDCEPTCTQASLVLEISAPVVGAAAQSPPAAADGTASAAAPPCLAPPPTIPAALPEDGRRCLEGLVAARERFAFLARPDAEATPCALEEIDEDGKVERRGAVSRAGPRTEEVVFEPTGDDGQRTVETRTVVRDAKGREIRRETVWDLYLEGESTPDCSDPTETRHSLDRRGWPTKTTKVIDSCEGVDAGTIVTKRRFAKHPGLVTASLSIVDRGTKLKGRGWWLPDPAAPVARGVTDHYDDVDCWLEVLDCEGAPVGRMHGRDEGRIRDVERHVWTCDPADG